MTQNDVSTPKSCHQEMCEKAKLARTLMGGTRAMRTAGECYLPREPKESVTAYRNRLQRTTLYNAFRKAVQSLNGKLFAKPISLSEDTPEQIEELLESVDRQGDAGRDYNRFLSHAMVDALAVGLTHVLVDVPPGPKGESGEPLPLSVAEARALNLRPLWLHYKMEDLFYWTADGERLTQVRLREKVTVPDGEWGEKEIAQIRVLRPGSFEVYREQRAASGKTEWVLIEEGRTALDFIPLVTIYTNRTGFMTAEPLLQDLADLNVAHWQSASDQRHILHVARVPVLFATGWEDSTAGEQGVGPNVLIRQPQGATLQYVEHSGAAIQSGDDDLKNLEDRMSAMAMEPLVPRTGNQTATAKAIDAAEATSILQDIAQGLKDSTEQLLVCTAAWIGIPAEQSGEVNVNADFSLRREDTAGLQELGKARDRGDLSRPQYLDELKRRDIIRPDMDYETNDTELESEGLALAEMGLPNGNQIKDDTTAEVVS